MKFNNQSKTRILQGMPHPKTTYAHTESINVSFKLKLKKNNSSSILTLAITFPRLIFYQIDTVAIIVSTIDTTMVSKPA